MEENVQNPEQKGQPVDFTRKRRGPSRTKLMIMVLLISATLVASALLLPKALDTSVQILEAGDHLHYDMKTHFKGTIYNGSMDYNITSAAESGIGYFAMGSGVGLIEDLGHDFKPYLAGPTYYGELIGTRELNTSFGVKCVKDLYRFDFSEVVVLSMGMDSSIVYRWTVSSSSGDYWYSYELTESNNTRLASVDKVMRVMSVKSSSTPSLTPGSSITFQHHEPGEGYGYMSGSVELGSGETFHYVVGGNMTVLVFDLKDLRGIQEAGEFTYQSALSRQQGNPGETNTTTPPGTYWFVAIYNGSNAPIPASELPGSLYADGYPIGAYFVGYFEEKGQNS